MAAFSSDPATLPTRCPALLRAVPERRLQQPPQHEQEHPDRDGPDEHLAERLLRELAHRPGGARLLAVVTERELDGQPRQQQVHDAVGDQPRPDEMVEGVALLDLSAHLLSIGHEDAFENSRLDCAAAIRAH